MVSFALDPAYQLLFGSRTLSSPSHPATVRTGAMNVFAVPAARLAALASTGIFRAASFVRICSYWLYRSFRYVCSPLRKAAASLYLPWLYRLLKYPCSSCVIIAALLYSLVICGVVPAFRNETLEQLSDGAVVEGMGFSTASFVVSPYFFPGGDIGKLSVCGTVNDIAVSGGIPKYLSLAMILEEGLPVEDLKKIVDSISRTADSLGVQVVTGDTKVVEKGKGDGIYINTAGIGRQAHGGLSEENLCEGDVVLVSGSIGNHGVAVMLARNPDFMQHTILSDCAPVCGIAKALFALKEDLRVMRDPTRGGVATTLCEFVEPRHSVISGALAGKGAGMLGIELDETSLPVEEDVQAACDMLGLDPLYCACEGRLLAVVAPERAEEALRIMQSVPGGENAQIIGRVSAKYPGRVVLRTAIGGTRVLTKLTGSQLPRIC